MSAGPKRFVDRVVIVTGGNSGIGEATVRAFAAEGAAVVVAARDGRRSAAVVEAIVSAGGTADAIDVDVTDPDRCSAAVQLAVDRYGGLDILFNNAGIIYRERTAETTTHSEWERTMAVNAGGTFLMSKFAVPEMLRRGGGAIINNASYYGLVGGRGVAAYAASKGAVVLLTKSMALDHASDGIRVNCICAGSVDTPMLSSEMEEMGGRAQVERRFAGKHPLGRIAQPEEIAAAVLYLASGDAAFVTGVALPVDGGITAG